MSAVSRVTHSAVMATEAFARVDAGDLSKLAEIDVLIDLPDVLTLARFHFTDGVGYEVIHSTAAGIDEYECAVDLVVHSVLVSHQPWGCNSSGYSESRSLYWELGR